LQQQDGLCLFAQKTIAPVAPLRCRDSGQNRRSLLLSYCCFVRVLAHGVILTHHDNTHLKIETMPAMLTAALQNSIVAIKNFSFNVIT
jgi:hypothetical protein